MHPAGPAKAPSRAFAATPAGGGGRAMPPRPARVFSGGRPRDRMWIRPGGVRGIAGSRGLGRPPRAVPVRLPRRFRTAPKARRGSPGASPGALGRVRLCTAAPGGPRRHIRAAPGNAAPVLTRQDKAPGQLSAPQPVQWPQGPAAGFRPGHRSPVRRFCGGSPARAAYYQHLR